MEKMGTLKKNGDQKTNFGPHGDQSPQMGTNVGAVETLKYNMFASFHFSDYTSGANRFCICTLRAEAAFCESLLMFNKVEKSSRNASSLKSDLSHDID